MTEENLSRSLRGNPSIVTEPAATVDCRDHTTINAKREQLITLAGGWQAHQFLGRNLTSEQIDTMTDEEIEKCTPGIRRGLARLCQRG